MPVLAATAEYGSAYRKTHAVYLTAHDAATTETLNGVQFAYVGQNIDYTINRGGLFFNTLSIPSDAAIISATLSLYVDTDFSTTDFNVTVVNGSALIYPPAQTGQNAVYGNLLAATASGGIISSSALSGTAYNDISLNATGLGFITKAGTTKLALRSSRDIASTVPTNDEYVYFNGDDPTNPAKLTVSYEAKGNLFVKAERLHYVSYTGIEYYIQGIAV